MRFLLVLLALMGLSSRTVAAWKRSAKFASVPPGSSATNQQMTPEVCDASEKATAKEMGLLSNYVTSLFNEADTNHDGDISPSEVYELVLKFYVKVNQQAPVSVPSRERVMALFNRADVSNTGRLDLSEFRRLLRTLYARVSSRVLAFKVIKVLLAPPLAVSLVDVIKNQPSLIEWFENHIPERTPTVVVNLLGKESLWSALFTLTLVIGLSKSALAVIDKIWWGNVNSKEYDGCENDLVPND